MDEPSWSGPTAQAMLLLHREYARLGVKVSQTKFPGVHVDEGRAVILHCHHICFLIGILHMCV